MIGGLLSDEEDDLFQNGSKTAKNISQNRHPKLSEQFHDSGNIEEKIVALGLQKQRSTSEKQKNFTSSA